MGNAAGGTKPRRKSVERQSSSIDVCISRYFCFKSRRPVVINVTRDSAFPKPYEGAYCHREGTLSAPSSAVDLTKGLKPGSRSTKVKRISSLELLGKNDIPFENIQPVYSVEGVADAADSDEDPLPLRCQKLLDSDRLKGLVRFSWKKIINRSPDLVDTCICLSVKTYIGMDSTKNTYPILDEESSRSLINKACEKDHIHQAINAISMAISHLDEEESLSKVLRKMGARHTSYGVCAPMYFKCYMEAICSALKELAYTDFQCNKGTIFAWTILCEIITFHAIKGARQMLLDSLRPKQLAPKEKLSSHARECSLLGKLSIVTEDESPHYIMPSFLNTLKDDSQLTETEILDDYNTRAEILPEDPPLQCDPSQESSLDTLHQTQPVVPQVTVREQTVTEGSKVSKHTDTQSADSPPQHTPSADSHPTHTVR